MYPDETRPWMEVKESRDDVWKDVEKIYGEGMAAWKAAR